MSETMLDLKQLIQLINSEKELNANLILDEGCTIYTEDPNPLLKVINYIINYLNQQTEYPLEISLDLSSGKYRLTFLAFTLAEEIPIISDKLEEALTSYQASYSINHEKGKFIKITVIFEQ